LLQTLDQVRSLSPRPPRDLCANVPPELESVCLLCLAKSPQDRPRTAANLAEHLRSFLEAHSAVPLAQPAPATPVHPGGSALVHPQREEPTLARSKRRLPRWGWAAAITLLLLGALLLGNKLRRDKGENAAPVMSPVTNKESINVGILFSLRGPMASGGSAAHDAAQLAIDELNQQGGSLGHPIEAIHCDGESDYRVFAEQAEKLITKDHVRALFGTRASSHRKAILPIVEKYDNVLFYPMQLEGLEDSPNVIYLGAAPNQQILPAIDYMLGKQGKHRLFLVGSDSVFPRAANEILRYHVRKKYPGVEIVDEKYIPFGSSGVQDAIKAIQEKKSDLIVNMINGDTNSAFFRELYQAGIRADKMPVLSFSVGENDLVGIGEPSVGHYAAWSYFQSIDRQENREFIRKFSERFGSRRVISDPMETVYFGVQLWAQAVQAAGSVEPRAVREAIKGLYLEAPEGGVRIDSNTRYTWRPMRIGRIQKDGQFKIIYDTQWAWPPEPFPSTRPRAEWERFLRELYTGWGDRWEAGGNRR
jgi:urea transport system substrate-binding protein